MGAALTELQDWLSQGAFEGQRCSLDQLESTVRQISLEWMEDLLLFLALPERLVDAKDRIVKAVNQRKGHTVCVVLTFAEVPSQPGSAMVSTC